MRSVVCWLGSFRLAVVLLQFPIDGLSANIKQTSRPGFVSRSIVERGLNRMALDLVHRRRHVYFQFGDAAFTGGLRSLDANQRLSLGSDIANGGRQVIELDLSSRGNDHTSLDCIFKFPDVARPVVANQSLKSSLGNA